MRFFGGSLESWLDKDTETISMLVKCMDAIKAGEMLDQITVTNFPQLKKQAKQSMHDDLVKRTRVFHQEQKALTTKELAQLLGGSLGG
jgi:hypothetical protein